MMFKLPLIDPLGVFDKGSKKSSSKKESQLDTKITQSLVKNNLQFIEVSKGLFDNLDISDGLKNRGNASLQRYQRLYEKLDRAAKKGFSTDNKIVKWTLGQIENEQKKMATLIDKAKGTRSVEPEAEPKTDPEVEVSDEIPKIAAEPKTIDEP